VTVSLSDEATHALASATPATSDGAEHVQLPASMLAAIKPFETTSPTAYSDQIGQYATTINDANASDQDRLDAWTSLTGMLTSGTIAKAGNVADLQTAVDATQVSGYAKSLLQLEDQFHSVNVRYADRDRNNGQAGAQGTVDALNSFSDSDQQKLFVLMGLNQTYSDVATMKADYQNVSDIYASTGQLTKATMQLSAKSTDGTSSAPSAAAAPQESPITASGAETASAAAGSATASDVALTLLQNGAAYSAKAAADQKTRDGDETAEQTAQNATASATTPTYKQGHVLSLVA
jgi:hypothetical protein